MNNAGIIDLLPRELRQQWVQDGTYPNQSVYSLFRNHAKAHPSKPAILALDKTVTYGELLDKANRLANSLQKMGIVDGDVVAYQLKNTWRCCAIDLAVAALGAIVAPFPPGRGRLDIELLIKRCSARVVIVEPQQGDLNMGEIIQSLRPKLLSLRSLVMNGHKPEGWLNLDDLFDEKPIENSQLPTVCADWPVRLLVSSGTESEPKLVAYSHNALVGGRGRFLQRIDAKGDTFRGLYLVPMGSSFGSTATFGILSWLGEYSINRFSHPDASRYNGADYRYPSTYVENTNTSQPYYNIANWKQVSDSIIAKRTEFVADNPGSYPRKAYAGLSCITDVSLQQQSYNNSVTQISSGQQVYDWMTDQFGNNDVWNDNPTWAIIPRVIVAPVCGNNICETGENASCPEDCQSGPGSSTGSKVLFYMPAIIGGAQNSQ